MALPDFSPTEVGSSLLQSAGTTLAAEALGLPTIAGALTGGTLSGALGLSAAAPYLAPLLIGGSLLLGKMGKKPSVGPNFNVRYSGIGGPGVTVRAVGTDNNYSPEEARGYADAFGSSLTNALRSVGGTAIDNGLQGTWGFNKQRGGYFYDIDGQGGATDDLAEAQRQYVLANLAEGRITVPDQGAFLSALFPGAGGAPAAGGPSAGLNALVNAPPVRNLNEFTDWMAKYQAASAPPPASATPVQPVQQRTAAPTVAPRPALAAPVNALASMAPPPVYSAEWARWNNMQGP